MKSDRSDDPWISSHLELRGTEGELLPGYGWIFPLCDGEVNLGVGALATAKRPADLQIRPLMEHYAHLRRDEWGLGPDLRMPTSALLPMGGAVSGVAGPNWIVIGDAAGCVNPLNGEGIDYGLETGRVGAELMDEAGTTVSTSSTPGRCCSRRTTARPSPSPAGSPASSPSRACCRRPARSACVRTAS